MGAPHENHAETPLKSYTVSPLTYFVLCSCREYTLTDKRCHRVVRPLSLTAILVLALLLVRIVDDALEFGFCVWPVALHLQLVLVFAEHIGP